MEREPKPKSGFESLFNPERSKEEEEAQSEMRRTERAEAEEERSKERKKARKLKTEQESTEQQDKKRLESAAERVKKVLEKIFRQQPQSQDAAQQLEAAAGDGELVPDDRVVKLRKRLAGLVMEARNLVRASDRVLAEAETPTTPDTGVPAQAVSEPEQRAAAAVLEADVDADEAPDEETEIESEAISGGVESSPESDEVTYGEALAVDADESPAPSSTGGSGASPPAVQPSFGASASGGGGSGFGGAPRPTGFRGGGGGGPVVPVLPPTRPTPEDTSWREAERKSSWVPPFLIGALGGWWLGRRGPKREIGRLEKQIDELTQGKRQLEAELSQQSPAGPEMIQTVPLIMERNQASPAASRPETHATRVLPERQRLPARIEVAAAGIAVAALSRPERVQTQRAKINVPPVERAAKVVPIPMYEQAQPPAAQETAAAAERISAPEPAWVEDIRRAVAAERPVLAYLRPEQRQYLERHQPVLLEKAKAIERKQDHSPEIQDTDAKLRFGAPVLSTDSAAPNTYDSALNAPGLPTTHSPNPAPRPAGTSAQPAPERQMRRDSVVSYIIITTVAVFILVSVLIWLS